MKTCRKMLTALAGAATIASMPATACAQDNEPEIEMFDFNFEVEPLTAEQEQRVPAAEQVVDRIFPAGTYARLMDESMGPVMEAISGSVSQAPIGALAAMGGVENERVAQMGDARLADIMAIVDPAYQDRNDAIMQLVVEMIGDLMDRIEPAYRQGLVRAYASRFSQDELAELNSFFATPVGAHYAAESMLIFADPQVMGAMNEMGPAMNAMMPRMIERMAAMQEQYPPMRSFDELSRTEQQQLADLLGVTRDQLEANAGDTGE